MKKIISVLLCCIVACLMPLTACFSVGGDDALSIAEIISTELADGSIKITIIYSDDEMEPTEFTIPQVEKGEDGIGIDYIELDEEATDEQNTYIKIYYDSSAKQPDTVAIPRGTYIKSIIEGEDSTTITFALSDGTSKEIILKDGEKGDPGQNGKDGEDGKDGTKWYTGKGEPTGGDYNDGDFYVDEDTFMLYIMESGSWRQFGTGSLKGEQGEDGEKGVGVQSMSLGKETDTAYIYYLYLTDGSDTIIEIPKRNVWYSGNGIPNDTEGNTGDFWLDTRYNKIYCKKTTGWEVLVDFSNYASEEEPPVTYTVTFRPVYPDQSLGAETTYTVEAGSYLSNIPVMSVRGYTFLGWYTQPQFNENGDFNSNTVNAGKFTDLTPVFGNITLYSWWEF